MARFARQIAGQGYICVAPSSYHEFTGPEPLKYDAEDTDKGNAWKVGKVSEIRQLPWINSLLVFSILVLYWAILVINLKR